MSKFFEPRYWRKITPEGVKLELNSGMNVNTIDSYGNTSLMFASCCSNYPEIIQMLIDAGADVNAKNYKGITPLIIACDEGKNPDIVITLLNNGANVYPKSWMWSPYYCLVENDHLRNTRAYWRLLKECTKESSFGKRVRAFIN